MSNTQQRVTIHEPDFVPLLSSKDVALQKAAQQEVVTKASAEAAAREAAMSRDMNRGLSSPKPLPAQVRAPQLDDDHARRLEKLDRAIYERGGVAVGRDKLLKLGRERFKELLQTDRQARSERLIGPRIDLSSWSSVFYAFAQAGALLHLPVPAPTTHQQLSGLGAELDQAREIAGFDDLWKLYGSEPRAVRAVYAFRDLFESLIFGQSLFALIDDDGRVHHQ